jgi:Flp pilus assembly pilin Flp
MTNIWRRWLTEEDGQDLIEYALLCSFIGFTATAAIGALGNAMNSAYVSWDNAGQSDTLVEVPDPQ